MVANLEQRLIGRPKNTYKPVDGFESILGNRPIKIIKSSTEVLGKNSKIKKLQILHLEDKIDSENKDGLIRQIALLEDRNGNKVAIYFYQDNFDPKRKKSDGYLSQSVFGDVATVGQISVISAASEKNKKLDLLYEADKLTRQHVVDSKMSGLKDNENIRISGSGTVIVTDLNLDSFIEADELQQAIGELFKPKGIFKNNLVVPSTNNTTLVANMEQSGAQVLYKTNNFPNILGLFMNIISESELSIEPKVLENFYNRLMPLFAYVPFFEKLFEDVEVQMGYRDITEYMKKQLLPLIKQIHSGLTI